jgi:ABC-type multidrug transport system fused ATPase/permease subunit
MSDGSDTRERAQVGAGRAETGADVQPVENEALPSPSARVPSETDDRRPVLELRNVSTHYGMVAVLRNVNVEIYPGEMVCLLGGNASGKTTTLKTILGYVTPSEG